MEQKCAIVECLFRLRIGTSVPICRASKNWIELGQVPELGLSPTPVLDLRLDRVTPGKCLARRWHQGTREGVSNPRCHQDVRASGLSGFDA